MGKKKKLILIVDDQIRVVKLTADILEEAGFDTTGVTSGREALDILESRKPDIILLDIIMPDMSGLDVLNELRTFCEIPVIATSFDLASCKRALASGATTFLAKPYKPEELLTNIEKLLDEQ